MSKASPTKPKPEGTVNLGITITALLRSKIDQAVAACNRRTVRTTMTAWVERALDAAADAELKETENAE